MSAGACTHGMPSPASCVDCMNDDGLGAAPIRPVEPAMSEPLSAIFGTRCPYCEEGIAVGDQIMLFSDGTWRHPGCW